MLFSNKYYIPPDAVISPREIFNTHSRLSEMTVDRLAPNVRFYQDGKTALCHGLKNFGIQEGSRVLIPDYVCPTVPETVSRVGAEYSYYRVNGAFQPDPDDLEEKAEGASAIIIIHYFGFPQPVDEIVRLCEEKNLLLIEDCAHALFSRRKGRLLGSFGDFSIFSMRKTLPLPDGGMLMVNNGSLHGDQPYDGKSSVVSRFMLAEKWVEFKTGVSPRCLVLRMDGLRRRVILSNKVNSMRPEQDMSLKSFQLYSNVNENMIVEKRRKNYEQCFDSLMQRDDIVIPFPELPTGVSPLVFPVLLDNRDVIRKRLLKKKINLRTFWDILPDDVSRVDHRFAHELSARILLLPVHQSLEPEHIEYTLKQLRAVLET